MMKFDRADAQSILSDFKRQDKQIKLKTKWLLGIPLTKYKTNKLKKYIKNSHLSESLIREDDMFYESVRTHVEEAFGTHYIEQQENHVTLDDVDLIQLPDMKRLISPCLDNLTTKGLYLLAMVVTGGSFNSEVTRCKLKKVIKGSLSSVLGSKSHNCLETRKQIFLLLTNPQNFRDRCDPLAALRPQSHHASVARILRGLQRLSCQTLDAMRRKLKGVKVTVPQLQPRRHGWTRDHLVKVVKKISMEMLSQLDRESGLQEPLAKAMAVADLSQKLNTGCHNIFSKEFYQFSPEVKSLQSDIVKAIWSVKKVLTVPELRKLQLLIEPKAIISNRSIRAAFVTFLVEFLFECSDVDSVPTSLSQILDIINRGSNSCMNDVLFKKKYIEDEVDCILNMSASTKQIVLDLLPDDEFDKDFTDAYSEQLEESDYSSSDENDDDNGCQRQEVMMDSMMDSFCEAESIGDFVPFEENVSSSLLTTSDKLNSGSEQLQPNNCDTVNLESKVHNTPHNMFTDQCQRESTEHFHTFMACQNNNSSVVSPDRELDQNVVKRNGFSEADTNIDATVTANLFCKEKEPMPTKYRECKNQYLAVQDACDKTSMLAYNLIGHMLEEFVKTEGLDLNMSKSLYLSVNNHIEVVEDTKKQSSSGKHARDFVQVIEELIPSFPDSSMERLKMLMSL